MFISDKAVVLIQIQDIFKVPKSHTLNTKMAALGCIDPKTNHNNNINQPKINLAFADRLKPTCSQRSSMSSPSSSSLGHDSDSSNNLDSSWSRNNLYLRAERSRNNPHGSPTQYRAKAIIRKYRRHVRQVEFKRLRSIVPAVAGNEKASQVSRISYVSYLTVDSKFYTKSFYRLHIATKINACLCVFTKINDMLF